MKPASQATNTRTPMPVRLGLIAALGASMALVATYWDDAWHTDKGRDEFAIPPHLLLYGGVLATSLAVVAWAVSAGRRFGAVRVRALAGDPALLLAGLGGVTTLASAPLDEAWHALYGRDAVLWSPPHLLAVAGTLGLSAGVLAGLRATAGRGSFLARTFAAAGIIGALQVPVLEYDTDVPQFSTLWYLPVAAFGLCMALVLIEDLSPGRWRPLQAAALYTAVRAAVAIGLSTFGFSGAAIPTVLVPVLAGAFTYRLSLRLRLPIVAAVSALASWPLLRIQGGLAAPVPPDQLPAALGLAILAGLLVAVAHGEWSDLIRGRRIALRASLLGGLALVSVLAVPGSASAHDPGQGTQQSSGQLTVERRSDRAAVLFDLPVSCAELRPLRTVARRAGTTVSGTLRAEERGVSGCRLEGRIAGLTDGRWFVYVEVNDAAGASLEAWLPSKSGSTVSDVRPLYRPPASRSSIARTVAGGGILLVVAGLLVACLRLARRSASVPENDIM